MIFFDSHFQFFTGKNLLGFEIYNSQISSIFGSELILGSFLIKLLPIIIFLFFYSNIEIKKYSLLLIFFLSFLLFSCLPSCWKNTLLFDDIIYFSLYSFSQRFKKDS